MLRLLVKGWRNKLIGSALGIAEVTVKLHISRILAKMGATDRMQAATRALQQGIVHLGP